MTYWETLDENGKMDYEYRHAKTERIFEDNNRPEISIIANQGDAVLFHGGLIHRGGPIKQRGALRHVNGKPLYTLSVHGLAPHKLAPNFL